MTQTASDLNNQAGICTTTMRQNIRRADGAQLHFECVAAHTGVRDPKITGLVLI